MARTIWGWIGVILVSLVIVLVAIRITRAYDQAKPDVDPVISDIAEFTYVRVRVIGVAEGMYYDKGKWQTKKTLFHQSGSGCVVRDGFILTCAHVVVPENVETIIGKYSTHLTKPLRVIKTLYLIYHFSNNPIIAELHYIDPELDIAILSYKPSGILEPLTCEIHYAQEMLKKGDVVFSFLHKRGENGRMKSDLELRYGHVLSPLPTMPKMGSELAFLSPYDMTLLMSLQGGDSGSPLFAFSDGEPVLIGILRAVRNDEIISLSYAVSLPNIRRYVNIGN